MKGKVALVTAAAAGYVLGTRAGRQRYEQMKAKAEGLWQDPKVQEKAAQAQGLVRENAPKLQEKAVQATQKATAAAKKAVSDGGSPSTTTTSTTAATPSGRSSTTGGADG